jgi:hypothetical protein
MKEYKVVVYREGILGTLFFGSSQIDPEKFTHFLNEHASAGWRVIAVELDVARMLLIKKRSTYFVIMEREKY